MALIAHVVGARPNFVKAAPVLAALQREPDVSSLLIHTGQHYDRALSDVFFEQHGIREPDVQLGVGSASHAVQTAALLTGLETTLLEHRPDVVVVYGDVNSTLAAALVCAKLDPAPKLVHVEAGLRSFDRSMPEEVNRVVTDQLADLLLVTSAEAVGHLANEGVDVERIRFVGNPMIDSLLGNQPRLDGAAVRERLGLPDRLVVTTLHRPSNVDDPGIARAVVAALTELAADCDVVVPLHPRGRARMAELGLHDGAGVHVIEPLGYLEFLALVRDAALVVTDSGGVQEETTVFGVPCLTVRENTERPVTITDGTNRLVAPGELAALARAVPADQAGTGRGTPPLWDGFAGPRCAEAILALLAP